MRSEVSPKIVVILHSQSDSELRGVMGAFLQAIGHKVPLRQVSLGRMLVTGKDPHLVPADLLSQPRQFCHVPNLDLPHRNLGVLEIGREVVVARDDDVIETRGFDPPAQGGASSVVPVERTQVWALASKHDALITESGGLFDELLDRKTSLSPRPRVTHREEDGIEQSRSLPRPKRCQLGTIMRDGGPYDPIDWLNATGRPPIPMQSTSAVPRGACRAKELAIHVIADDYCTHKRAKVQAWLGRHKRFQMHSTPTSSSWPHLVERFFVDLTEDCVREGSFASVKELTDAITTYLAERNRGIHQCCWASPRLARRGSDLVRFIGAIGTGRS